MSEIIGNCFLFSAYKEVGCFPGQIHPYENVEFEGKQGLKREVWKLPFRQEESMLFILELFVLKVCVENRMSGPML